MTLTKEVIKDKLLAIRNQYNEYKMDDNAIDRSVSFIYYDEHRHERTEEKKKVFLSITINDNYLEFVKEYSYVVLLKNKYGRYYIYLKGRKHPSIEIYLPKEDTDKIDEIVFKPAEEYNRIFEQKYVYGEVEFPSGEIYFSNYFHNSASDDYAFGMPDGKKYKSLNSINHLLGESNTMRILSEVHGLGYVQLGNTSADVYKINDDKMVITDCYLEDPDTEEEVEIPAKWEKIGNICCDVWRVEFIDKINFDKGDALPLDDKAYDYNKPFKMKVNPGTWAIKNRYRSMDDHKMLKQGKVPVWVEIERKK